MPIFNFSCKRGENEACKSDFEAYIHSTSHSNPKCEGCGGETERVWALGVTHRAANGFPFTTTHISQDGSSETFENQADLDRACKERGLNHRPDAAFIGKEYLGVDFKTGQQKYKEGNGMGMPNCWY